MEPSNKILAKLNEQFLEYTEREPREVARSMEGWLTDERKLNLASTLETLKLDHPEVPLEALFSAILKIKEREIYCEIGQNIPPSDLCTALRTASSGLLSYSIFLDQPNSAPIILNSGEQMSWSEIAEHLSDVADFVENQMVRKDYSYLKRKGGPTPAFFQNLLLFLITDIIEKSTGKADLDAVADVFNVLGFRKESAKGQPEQEVFLDQETVRKRLIWVRKILKSKRSSSLSD